MRAHVPAHGSETLNYLVVEAGVHTLPGGGTLVAGKADVNYFFEPVSFATGFSGPPAVLAQVMTANGTSDVVAARIAGVQASNFQLRVQEQKSANQTHSDETVGYVAIAPSSGQTPGVGIYEAIVTTQSITDAWSTWNFSPAFLSAPRVLAATQTNAEADTATARLRNIAAGNTQLHVEEENSNGSGTTHAAAEKIALLAFANSGLLYDQALVPQPPTTSYIYDAAGHRVQRTHDPDGSGNQPPTSEYFVYDGNDLSMRFDNGQKLSHRYLYGPQTDQVLVDEVFKTISGQQVSDEILWQLADHEGTIRDIVDDAGALRKHVDYDSFGQITNETTYGQAIDQLFAFTGQELDKDAGLYNYNARWYDPRLGRF